MSNKSSKCCTSSSCCKELVIELLYLDLSVCERCQGAENNLDAAINQVSTVLASAGYEIKTNKININTKELAIKYEFLSSPTIRINGNDIDFDIKETECEECGDLCGDDVDCRVWVYEGVEYNEPPKEMIVNAILREVYGSNNNNITKRDYVLPENLRIFFDGIKGNNK